MINWDLVVDKKSFIEQAQDVLPTIEIDSLTNYGASLLNRDRDGFAKKIVIWWCRARKNFFAVDQICSSSGEI